MGDQEKAGRTRSGQFAPGHSGNPSGKPKGCRDHRTVMLENLLDDGGEDVLRKLVESAKDGKPWAMRLVVERVLPARRDRRVELADLPPLRKADDVAAAAARVIGLVASGDMTVEEGRAFLQLLEVQRKAIETADLAVRLELLEAQGNEEAGRERRRLSLRRGEVE